MLNKLMKIYGGGVFKFGCSPNGVSRFDERGYLWC